MASNGSNKYDNFKVRKKINCFGSKNHFYTVGSNPVSALCFLC